MRSRRRIACLVENNGPAIRAHKPTFNRLQKLLGIRWPDARIIDIESKICPLTRSGLSRKMDCGCNKSVGRAETVSCDNQDQKGLMQ